MKSIQKIQASLINYRIPFIVKLFNWEFWPASIIYLPLVPLYLYHCFLNKSLFYFYLVNPALSKNNIIDASKIEMYNCLPDNTYGKTFLINNKESIERQLHNNGLSFPFFIKPNKAVKGKGAKLILNKEAFNTHSNQYKVDLIAQEPLAQKNEIGIFYKRLPNDMKGTITGLVAKEKLNVVGDGLHTIKDLIKKHNRAFLYKKEIALSFSGDINYVPKKNETIVLSNIGNHARGCLFTDVSHLINENLVNTIDSLSQQIQGFYYGRFDIMYDNFEELCIGKNFKIVELNGVESEPTHIYDPNKKYFEALKIIKEHLAIMSKIAIQNKPKNKLSMNFKTGFTFLINEYKYYNKIS